VSAAALESALGGIEAEAPDGSPEPLLTAAERSRIAGPLAEALADARADQDIVFASDAPELRQFIHPKHLGTSGRVFVSDGALNIIFGWINRNYDDDVHFSRMAPTFTPGSRKESRWSRWKIVDAGQGSQPRADWVRLPLASLKTVPTKAKSGTDPKRAPSRTSSPDDRATNPAATAASTGSETRDTTRESASVRDRYDKVVARLKLVERLHDDGLITDAEYRRKRKEILGGI
jgi:hypothetical protein